MFIINPHHITYLPIAIGTSSASGPSPPARPASPTPCSTSRPSSGTAACTCVRACLFLYHPIDSVSSSIIIITIVTSPSTQNPTAAAPSGPTPWPSSSGTATPTRAAPPWSWTASAASSSARCWSGWAVRFFCHAWYAWHGMIQPPLSLNHSVATPPPDRDTHQGTATPCTSTLGSNRTCSTSSTST